MGKSPIPLFNLEMEVKDMIELICLYLAFITGSLIGIILLYFLFILVKDKPYLLKK